MKGNREGVHELIWVLQIFLPWTILLDPRLTVMNVFSPEKQSVAEKELPNQMKNALAKLCYKQDEMFDGNADPSLTNSSLLGYIFAAPGSHKTMEEHFNQMKLDKYL